MRWVLVFWAALFIGGCSTARDGGSETSLWDSYKGKDPSIEADFEERFKTATVYLDYTTALQVDALYRDRSYRLFFASELADTYYLDDESKAKIWAKHTEEYENQYSFVVVLYPGSNKAVRFGKPSSEWQAYLKDDEGDLLRPMKVKRISKKNKELIFLYKYLPPLDRWSQTYLVSFPKLHRDIAEGSQPVELIISGIKGKAKIKFEDLSLFTQSRESYQLD